MKNRGLAIIFGLLPGAGHMYLGKMKRGLTLMILFWGIIGVSGSMGFALPLFALPIIWFYAFFDCLNLSAMDNGSLERAPDEWAFGWFSEDSGLNKHKDWFQKKNLWLGPDFNRRRHHLQHFRVPVYQLSGGRLPHPEWMGVRLVQQDSPDSHRGSHHHSGCEVYRRRQKEHRQQRGRELLHRGRESPFS